MSKPMTAFMWGYSGWGNATDDFVASADAVERARGYKPPLFVDIRVHRDVRAKGFQDDRFEKTVGKARYRWMRGLGNQSKATKTGRRVKVKIRNPECGDCLLDLIVAQAADRRRILFFCTCELPCKCHRLKVAELVLAAARRRRQALAIEEWPGGEADLDAGKIVLRVSEVELSHLKDGDSGIYLNPRPLAKFAGLACGTLVTAKSSTRSVAIPVASAMGGTDSWFLPILWDDDNTPTRPTAKAIAAWRRKFGYTPLRYAPKRQRTN